jgi:hypothetical protein
LLLSLLLTIVILGSLNERALATSLKETSPPHLWGVDYITP